MFQKLQQGEQKMSKRNRTAALVVMLVVAATATTYAQSISVASMPPSVIKTTPACGDTQVSTATRHIKVTFSKKMMDKSWSFTQISGESFPEIVGQPKYLADGRTCVLTVKLKPKKTYVLWLNSQKFQNFKDSSGTPAVPYLLVFQTK